MMKHNIIQKMGIFAMVTSLISCSAAQPSEITYIPTSFQYEEYGGMENVRYSISYDREKGKIIVENNHKTKKYSVNINEVNQKIDAFILKYDLTNWQHQETEEIALDAPTENIEITCENGFSFTLNSEEEHMYNSESVILKFRELIQTFY